MTSKDSFWKQYFPRMYDRKYWPVLILFMLFILSLRLNIYPALIDINTSFEEIKEYDKHTTFFGVYDQKIADNLVEQYYKKVEILYYSLTWPSIILILMILFPYANFKFGWIR